MGANLMPPDLGPGIDSVPGPLGVFDTVRVALGLYRADMVTLWQVMAIVIVPQEILLFVLRDLTVPTGAFLQNGKLYVFNGTDGGFVTVTFLGYLLTLLVLLLSIGASYRILLGRHLHHPADLGTSFGFALTRARSLLWLIILTALCVLVGFVCLIIPGIYLAVTFAIVVPVLMAEDARGFKALARSQGLIAGCWWHVLGCLIVAGIAVAFGELVISLIANPLVNALSPHSITGFLVIDAVVNAVVSILFAPFAAAVPVVIYVDMLVRQNDPQLQRLLA
jgi:hypothetical protein